MASTYLTRTSTTVTNDKKFTVSAWVKGSDLGGSVQAGVCGHRSTTNNGNNSFQFGVFNGGYYAAFVSNSGNDVHINKVTNRLLRDTNAWYHLVIAVDSTLGTASDRVKMYINGELQTSFSTDVNPPQDRTFLNNSCNIDVGRLTYTNGNFKYWDGIISHFHFVDGTAYPASTFGSTDSTTGEWKINTSPTVTYGNNGFFILKDTNSGTDQSSNTNNLSVAGGTLTPTEDCPSNVFATANPLNKTSNILLANGNCSVGTSNTGTDDYISGTIAFGNGKYYWENKLTSPGDPAIGIVPAQYNNNEIGNQRVMYHENGNIYTDGLGISAINTGVTYASGDIISVAFDTENGIIKWYKNNTLVNNSTITNSQLEFSNKLWVPIFYCANGNGTATIQANFGNGYFGTTAVSSAGTNASNNGIFEYDVPSGYTALSTKGLNL